LTVGIEANSEQAKAMPRVMLLGLALLGCLALAQASPGVARRVRCVFEGKAARTAPFGL
jgi:hypothetical protein